MPQSSSISVMPVSFIVGGIPEPFIVSRHFRVGEIIGHSQKRIVSLDHNFLNWFADLQEELVLDRRLGSESIGRKSSDAEILRRIAGRGDASPLASLATIHRLMTMHAECPEADYYNADGWANIHFVADQLGIMRTISLHFSKEGCVVRAYPLHDDEPWENPACRF